MADLRVMALCDRWSRHRNDLRAAALNGLQGGASDGRRRAPQEGPTRTKGRRTL